MDTNPEMTRLHRLTQDEADLIHEYRLLLDVYKPALKDFVMELGKYESTKAAPTNSNIVRLFPG